VKTLKSWIVAGLCAVVLSAGLISGPTAMAQGKSGEKKTSTMMHESGTKKKASTRKKSTRSSKKKSAKKSGQVMSGNKKK
jgi:hypothetical protein